MKGWMQYDFGPQEPRCIQADTDMHRKACLLGHLLLAISDLYVPRQEDSDIPTALVKDLVETRTIFATGDQHGYQVQLHLLNLS